MTHEEVFKRSDGSRVKIICSARFNSYGGEGLIYDIRVHVCAPKKRTFNNVVDPDDYSFRRLGAEERKSFITEEQSKFVTTQEIYDTKVKLWEKLKP